MEGIIPEFEEISEEERQCERDPFKRSSRVSHSPIRETNELENMYSPMQPRPSGYTESKYRQSFRRAMMTKRGL